MHTFTYTLRMYTVICIVLENKAKHVYTYIVLFYIYIYYIHKYYYVHTMSNDGQTQQRTYRNIDNV